MQDPRLAKLADVLVNYSTRVKKNDLVRIHGSSVTEPLVAELFRAVLRAGGHPQVDRSVMGDTQTTVRQAYGEPSSEPSSNRLNQ